MFSFIQDAPSNGFLEMREKFRLEKHLFLVNHFSLPSSLLRSLHILFLLEYAERLIVNFAFRMFVTAFCFKQFFRNFAHHTSNYDKDCHQFLMHYPPNFTDMSTVHTVTDDCDT